MQDCQPQGAGKEHEPESNPAAKRHACDPLRNLHVERVGRRGGEAHGSRHEHESHTEHAVVSQPPGHQQEERHERNELLTHAQRGSPDCNDRHQNDREKPSRAPESFEQPLEQRRDGSCTVKDSEHPAHEKDQEDDVARALQPAGNGGEESNEARGTGLIRSGAAGEDSLR